MKLIFATQNENKLIEIQNLLGSSFELLSLKDYRIFEEIPETKNTIKENAYEKASYIYNKTKTSLQLRHDAQRCSQSVGVVYLLV